ncbi:MAG: squalene--hopene cyclase [Armatimonadetes bacterium]|nr:squalene--hopene cyclase [Armatimonadota bacterium]
MTTATASHSRIAAAHHAAAAHLLARLKPEGYWEGQLSSSALSTATAMSALAVAGCLEDVPLLAGGAAWLAHTQNSDGGWGDTTDSPSNLATTLLSLSALVLTERASGGLPAAAGPARRAAEEYVACHAGAKPEARVAAIRRRYGADRTFAVPILMNGALAGLVPWPAIPGLPFELAALPRGLYPALRLHVVSYALPALIAIGVLLARRNPAPNPLARALRRALEPMALRKLETLQPRHGGFLEATPLTAFVAMSLLSLPGEASPVARRCLEFLRASVRADGSWPIDTNLSVWLTTSATTALCAGGSPTGFDAGRTRRWIQGQQLRVVHPYTGAAPGGWSWTHLPGGVPDGDDTSGAMLALAAAAGDKDEVTGALRAGAEWLLGLQNKDGGWPTFCRGWGQLPFDRSSPDITAHAIRALRAAAIGRRGAEALARGMRFLEQAQRADGAWVPLWFGNQVAPEQANPVYGTARVLLALAGQPGGEELARRGIRYLLGAQHADGGWGGDRSVGASVEETALATGALAEWAHLPEARAAMERGAAVLAERVERGDWTRPAPIGLYFASLWYSEELYPVIWTVEALGRVLAAWGNRGA